MLWWEPDPGPGMVSSLSYHRHAHTHTYSMMIKIFYCQHSTFISRSVNKLISCKKLYWPVQTTFCMAGKTVGQLPCGFYSKEFGFERWGGGWLHFLEWSGRVLRGQGRGWEKHIPCNITKTEIHIHTVAVDCSGSCCI